MHYKLPLVGIEKSIGSFGIVSGKPVLLIKLSSKCGVDKDIGFILEKVGFFENNTALISIDGCVNISSLSKLVTALSKRENLVVIECNRISTVNTDLGVCYNVILTISKGRLLGKIHIKELKHIMSYPRVVCVFNIENEEDFNEMERLRVICCIDRDKVVVTPSGNICRSLLKNMRELIPLCIQGGYRIQTNMQVLLRRNK